MREMRIKKDLVTTAHVNLKNMTHAGGAPAVTAAAGDKGVICERSEGAVLQRGEKGARARLQEPVSLCSFNSVMATYLQVLISHLPVETCSY